MARSQLIVAATAVILLFNVLCWAEEPEADPKPVADKVDSSEDKVDSSEDKVGSREDSQGELKIVPPPLFEEYLQPPQTKVYSYYCYPQWTQVTPAITPGVSFFTAWRSCRAMNQQLATVDSAAESQNLATVVSANGNGPVWIAGTDLGNTDSWIWFSTETPVTYTNWKAGNPVPGHPEHCVKAEIVGSDAQWSEDNCYTTNLCYVCQNIQTGTGLTS